MTTQSIALLLYSAGAVFAIWGPGIAAVRIIGKYRRAKKVKGTRAELNALVDRDRVHDAALRDAVWGVLEFAFVGLGVLLASIASIILIL